MPVSAVMIIQVAPPFHWLECSGLKDKWYDHLFPGVMKCCLYPLTAVGVSEGSGLVGRHVGMGNERTAERAVPLCSSSSGPRRVWAWFCTS